MDELQRELQKLVSAPEFGEAEADRIIALLAEQFGRENLMAVLDLLEQQANANQDRSN